MILSVLGIGFILLVGITNYLIILLIFSFIGCFIIVGFMLFQTIFSIKSSHLVEGGEKKTDYLKSFIRPTDIPEKEIIFHKENKICLDTFNDPNAGQIEEVHLPHKQ